MKKFHLALSVKNLDESIKDYSTRLGKSPDIVVDNTYALWRTDTLNISIRQEASESNGLRHLGFEDPDADDFTKDFDCNGIMWEHFSAQQQEDEINKYWPSANYKHSK